MEFRYMLQILNSILALMAIPPSLKLMKIVIRERNIVDTKQKDINRLLVYLFAGISVGAFINALISLNVLMDNGIVSHQISPFRSLFTNLFFLVISWFLYNFHKRIKKG